MKDTLDKLFRFCWWFLSFALLATGSWWWSQTGTIGGVPVPIITQFLGDDAARAAFIVGDAKLLHDRLKQLGVEESIKAYYRPQITDEAELDRYIHQLFYDVSGYLGADYLVDSNGNLMSKYAVDPVFREWFDLAYKAGLVTGSRIEDGVQYVIVYTGETIPFHEVSEFYSLDDLRKTLREKRQGKANGKRS